MKKIFSIFLIMLFGFTLVACSEPTYDRDVIVVFYTAGGTNIDRLVNPEIGSKIDEPTEPIKNGYDFKGWYKDIDYTDDWDFDVDTIEKSTTIYAKFTPINYVINYVTKYGESIGVNPESYTIERDVFLRAATLEGYTFNGWYTDAEFTNKVTQIKKGSTGNQTFYSRMGFKIQFDSTYLSVPRDIIVDPQTEIEDTRANRNILNPTRSGYEFGGWYSIDTRTANKEQVAPDAQYLVDFENKIIQNEFKVFAYWILK